MKTGDVFTTPEDAGTFTVLSYCPECSACPRGGKVTVAHHYSGVLTIGEATTLPEEYTMVLESPEDADMQEILMFLIATMGVFYPEAEKGIRELYPVELGTPVLSA